MKRTIIGSTALISISAAAVILILLTGKTAPQQGEDSPQFTEVPGIRTETGLLWGTPTRDQFPTVDSPRYLDSATADTYLSSEDRVYLIRKGGHCYVFPEVLLSTYHIVNDTIEGDPFAVSFCLLAGSSCGFSRKVGDRVLSFGITGQLYAGNSVIFDRETGTEWLQMNGEPMEGPLLGKSRLKGQPLDRTEWGRIRGDSNLKVLAPMEPMAEYRSFQKEIESEEMGRHVVAAYRKLDPRLLPYTRGLGIRIQGVERFYPREQVKKKRLINDVIGGWAILVYQTENDRVRVFRRTRGNRRLDFSLERGALRDRQTGSRWTDDGHCTEGPLSGAQLEIPFFTRVYWFAWSSIYPRTGLL